MGRPKATCKRKIALRTVLIAGTSFACLNFAHAQTVSDPFAPNVMAPTTPVGAPSAPIPVAPPVYEPPAPVPAQITAPVSAPVSPVVSTPLAPTPSPVPTPPAIQTVAPAPVEVPKVTPPKIEQAKPAESPSFWDRFTSLFESEDEAEENKSEQTQTAQPSVTPVSEAAKPTAPTLPESRDPLLNNPALKEAVEKARLQRQEAAQQPKSSITITPEPAEPVQVVTETQPTIETKPQSVASPIETAQELPVSRDPLLSNPELKEAVEAAQKAKTQLKLQSTIDAEATEPAPAETVKLDVPTYSLSLTKDANEAVIGGNETLSTSFVPNLPRVATIIIEDGEEVEQEKAALDEKEDSSFFDRLGNLFSGPDEETTTTELVKASEPADNPFATTNIAPQLPETPASAPAVKIAQVQESPVPPRPALTDAPSADLAEEETGMMDSITGFFGDMLGFGEDERQMVVEERPSAVKKAHEIQLKNNKAPTEIEKPETLGTIRPAAEKLLTARRLEIGKDLWVSMNSAELDKKASCFTKKRGTVVFCLIKNKWPRTVAKNFDVSTTLYQGSQTIVQFDENVATRLFTLFDETGFDELVAHYTKIYGAPTHEFMRRTRTFKSYIDNPTRIWRKENSQSGVVEVLEIRKFADMRGSIPDTDHGALRIYQEGSREIFALASDLDFMSLR
jgi:hypothetical protein